MLQPRKPYMLRNDGEVFECGKAHPYIINDVKKDNIKTRFSQLFILKNKDVMWFYTYSQNPEILDIIRQLAQSYLITYSNLSEWGNIKQDLGLNSNIPCTEDLDEIESLLLLLNKLTNQEFCRIRTSGLYRIGNDDCIYFRISSVGFNWFDLIWKTIYNNQQYNYLTVVRDEQSFYNINSTNEFYKINGKEINHFNTQDFILLDGHPIIENYSQYHSLAKNFICSANNKHLSESLYGNVFHQNELIDWLADEEKKYGFGWFIQ